MMLPEVQYTTEKACHRGDLIEKLDNSLDRNYTSPC